MVWPVVRCTLSGSFRRDIDGLKSAYTELVTCGCQVLSPHRLDFDSTAVLFVKDNAEQNLSEMTIEAHHLLAIKQSDFLWVHTPDGYIGSSVAYEIGYATAIGVPIFASHIPTELVFQPLLCVVPSVYKALEMITKDV